MRTKMSLLLGGGLLAAAAVSILIARDEQPPKPQPPKAERPLVAAVAKEDKNLDAAREAIRTSARDFEKAFHKDDAAAVAAFWTENGEYHEDGGVDLLGRAAIEKAYAELFKEKPHGKLEIDIQGIRFPSPDTAIEDGTIRLTYPGAELPTSTR